MACRFMKGSILGKKKKKKRPEANTKRLSICWFRKIEVFIRPSLESTNKVSREFLFGGGKKA